MYGAKVPTVAGVAMLPAASNSRPLFIAAVGLIATGVVIFVVATIISRKARNSEN